MRERQLSRSARVTVGIAERLQPIGFAYQSGLGTGLTRPPQAWAT